MDWIRYVGVKINVKCNTCNTMFPVAYLTFHSSKNKNRMNWKCHDCMRIYRSNLQKGIWNAYTPDEASSRLKGILDHGKTWWNVAPLEVRQERLKKHM